MGTMGRTWSLYKQSFAVLNDDVEILLFPVMSAIAAILVAASFFVPLYMNGTLAAVVHKTAHGGDYFTLFVWYYVNYFVVIFFNGALVACANIRLSGGNPTIKDGLRIAAARVWRIAAWALVASTVGVILNGLQDRRNRIGSLFGSFLGLAWTLITYLIVPVIMVEDLGISNSIERSIELFRKNWGEEVAGSFGFGLLGFLMCLPAFLLALLIFPYDRGFAIIASVIYLLIVATLCSAVKGVFTVALYRYARHGEVPAGFSGDLIDDALGGRRRGGWGEGGYPQT
jgi:hypothetical protein